MGECGVRALWVLSDDCTVCFSRRFPTVERQWRLSYTQAQTEQESAEGTSSRHFSKYAALPFDADFGKAFAQHCERQKTSRSRGVRDASSVPGTTDWLDDPITRHIISLLIRDDTPTVTSAPVKGTSTKEQLSRTDFGATAVSGRLLWPLIVHSKGPFYILVLPLVEPRHLVAYEKLRWQSDCGGSISSHSNGHGTGGLPEILRDLPAITSAFLLAHVVGDIITDSLQEQTNMAPSVGGLLDSLSAGMGLPVRPKGAPIPATNVAAMAPKPKGKVMLKAAETEALRAFICTAMPFGTPLDLNPTTVGGLRAQLQGSLQDSLPGDVKQPAWKPQLFQGGRYKISILLREMVAAALYDRDEVNDVCKVEGLVKCRCDLEGLPEITLSLAATKSEGVTSLTVHPCCQTPETVSTGYTLLFSPPLGPFELAHYEALPESPRLPLQGFYQLQMVSEVEAQFLIKLKLMEGYRSPVNMDFCTLSMPFPRRSIIGFDGIPSLGAASSSEHVVEWKIVTGGRGYSGRSFEATFPGTIRFLPLPEKSRRNEKCPSGEREEGDSDCEGEDAGSLKQTNGDLDDIPGSWVREEELQTADWDDPFSWEAYDCAKVAFKLVGGLMTTITVDTKKVGIYPATRAPIEIAYEVVSGDYILFNSLGRYPQVVKQPPSSL